jgi:hypothetical protein
MSAEFPLSRRQHEMITTMVSVTNPVSTSSYLLPSSASEELPPLLHMAPHLSARGTSTLLDNTLLSTHFAYSPWLASGWDVGVSLCPEGEEVFVGSDWGGHLSL